MVREGEVMVVCTECGSDEVLIASWVSGDGEVGEYVGTTASVRAINGVELTYCTICDKSTMLEELNSAQANLRSCLTAALVPPQRATLSVIKNNNSSGGS